MIRDIKVRYKRSVLGFAWMLLNPLISMIVFSIIFREVFGMEQDYPLYVISALLFFNLFSLGSSQGLNSIVASSGLIRKVAVPKAIFPLASVLANLVNFALSLIPLAAVMVFTGAKLTPALLLVPVGILAISLFTYGMSLALATANVFYRDVRWFYDSALLILFYVTPVIYPAKVVPEQFRFLLTFNPLTTMLEVGTASPRGQLELMSGLPGGLSAIEVIRRSGGTSTGDRGLGRAARGRDRQAPARSRGRLPAEPAPRAEQTQEGSRAARPCRGTRGSESPAKGLLRLS